MGGRKRGDGFGDAAASFSPRAVAPSSSENGKGRGKQLRFFFFFCRGAEILTGGARKYGESQRGRRRGPVGARGIPIPTFFVCGAVGFPQHSSYNILLALNFIL